MDDEINEKVNKTYFKIPKNSFPFILCTGMRFGLMEVKTGLCHILSRFEVAPCKDTPVRIVFEPKSVVLQMHGKIRLTFNRM
jgi:hypothetical protein